MKKNDLNEFNYNFKFNDTRTNINYDINYMLNKSLSMFDWVDLPDIPEKEIEKILQINGYAIITKINDKLIACTGGLGGVLDEYNRPTQAIVNIPYLNFNKTLNIGKDCILLKNDSMCLGLIPLYKKYLYALNENYITLNTSLILDRANKVFSAKDDNTYQSVNKYIEDIKQGNLTTILDRDMFDSFKYLNNTSNGSDIKNYLEINQYLKGSLYNEIGLTSNFNMKRERIQNAEIETNNGNIYPLLDDMYLNRLKGIEKINEMYGSDISINFNSSWRGRTDGLKPLDDKATDEPTEEPIEPIEPTEPTEEPFEEIVKGGKDEIKRNK